jgi:hypothetical protein
MIRHLSEQHRVTVASLVRSGAEEEEGRGLSKYADTLVGRVSEPRQTLRMLSRLPSRTPSSMGYFYSAELQEKIRQATTEKRFDLVFVHCSSVAQYVASMPGVPRILDFGDMDSQKWLVYSKVRRWPLSLGYRIEGKKLEREEKRLARMFDSCTCTTRLELETLRSYETGVDTDWFPNGVDASYFSPDGSEPDPDLISFVGRMDYYPNQQCMIEFCKNVFPEIRRRRNTTKLVIVGANPSARIQRLADVPGVSVTGSVPDVRPYVRGSALMIAPLTIARGTQNKILEAMAMGVPTVTSEIAAGGVDAVAGEHLLTGSSAADYVAATLRLLDSPDERRAFSIRGRQRMLSHHDWSASMTRMDAIIDRCLERSKVGDAALTPAPKGA